MPRHRQQSISDDAFDLLQITPMWVGPIFAAVAFVLFRFLNRRIAVLGVQVIKGQAHSMLTALRGNDRVSDKHDCW